MRKGADIGVNKDVLLALYKNLCRVSLVSFSDAECPLICKFIEIVGSTIDYCGLREQANKMVLKYACQKLIESHELRAWAKNTHSLLMKAFVWANASKKVGFELEEFSSIVSCLAILCKKNTPQVPNAFKNHQDTEPSSIWVRWTAAPQPQQKRASR